MNDAAQSWISLGLGGMLVSMVGFSIWKLIGAWMSLASTERGQSQEAVLKADILQQKLNEEISKRVALEVEVKFLEREVKELRERLHALERTTE
jgi:uncharacterized protein YlxW (UPF0749 family)